MTWPSKGLNGLHKEGLHSCSPLVGTASKVCQEPRVAINGTMNIKAIGSEFFIAILMPEGIGTTHTIDPTSNDTTPTAKKNIFSMTANAHQDNKLALKELPHHPLISNFPELD